MLSNVKIFDQETHVFANDLSNEIYSQLFYLQINCVKFLLNTLKESSIQIKELINTLSYFAEVGPELHKERECDILYVFQCCGRVLRLICDTLNSNEKVKLSRVIIVGLISLRLTSLFPQGSSFVSDLLFNVASGGLINLKIDFLNLREAFIKQPYISNVLVNIVSPISPPKDLYTSCLKQFIESFESKPEWSWKLLQLIGQCSSFTDFSVDFMKSILSLTYDKKCLRKHLIMEIGICQSVEQIYQFSLSFRDQIMLDIIRLHGNVPLQIVDIYEQLTYCLFVNGLPSLQDDQDSIFYIGWLILVTNARGVVSLLLNVIKTLIDSRLMDHLTILLKSPHMEEFNQLLLVNLWHPNLADEKTMQTLLNLCYSNKQQDIQNNYIGQLCLKIKTRWDTLKRFNERLSSIRKEHDTPTQLILDLTTMGNKSHLELVTGLLDPTGHDCKVVFDLLDRTGAISHTMSLDKSNGNVSFENEIIEEDCDKNIFYCSVSIRKLWECLVLSSSIETRHVVFKYLHQKDVMRDIDVIPVNQSFYMQMNNALLNNDLNLCHELYQQSLVGRLDYLSSHVPNIKPLSLRLELLENLYSMIFFTEFDLFNTILTANYQAPSYRTFWPMPETISVNQPVDYDKEEEVSPCLDKNRFVSSLFLLKDIVGILDRNIQLLILCKENLSQIPSSTLKDIDDKMAKLINYPYIDDFEMQTKIAKLSKLLEDLRWRIGLVTLHSLDMTYDTLGVFDFPVCINFDSNNRNLTDTCLQKPNKKTRSKSTVISRKMQQRTNKERLSSLGEDKENSHPEISSIIMQLGINQSTSSLTHSLSNTQLKDKFLLFSSPSTALLPTEPIISSDDIVRKSHDYNEAPKFHKMTKRNCHFLMNCLPRIMEPIDQLTITILNCGYMNKAEEIYEKYHYVKSDNLIFDDLLSEIKYRSHFDSFTAQLSNISTPTESTTVNKDEIVGNEVLPFGQFDWSKISALKEKLSSNKESDVGSILNQLLTLNNRNRPTIKFDHKSEKYAKELVVREIKYFNCGLFFDIAISGCTTKWQLSQTMSLLESHLVNQESPTGNDVTLSCDVAKYHTMQSLSTVVRQLLNAITSDPGSDHESYIELELSAYVDVKYSQLMTKWLLDLQYSIKSIEDDSNSRWICLTNLITLIKETCIGVNKKELPFRFLDRSILLYLDSLYSHLKIFVSFLEKYKHTSDKSKSLTRNSIVKLQHEFSVLRRSPLNALGELIFLKSEDPYCAEMLQISDDLGLNISAVVLENCIPSIDSCGCSSTSSDSDELFCDRRQLYNLSSEPLIDVVQFSFDPIDTVCGCLNRMIQILIRNSYTINQSDSNIEYDDHKEHRPAAQQPWKASISAFSISSQTSTDTSSSESSDKYKDTSLNTLSPNKSNSVSSNIMLCSGSRVFMTLCHDADWQDLLVSDIVEIENVNLQLLKTNHEKATFFLNLYNIMMIHMTVLAVESGKSSLKFRGLESKLMRSNFCYKVGQIGTLSIEQISQYYLNIPDVTFTDYNNLPSEINSSPPTVTEQLYRSSCVTCQNMVIFGMIDGTVSGQPLKIYSPDTIHNDLEKNLSYTIKYKTTYETEKRQIFLPQIFKWYSKLVCAENVEQRRRLGSQSTNSTVSGHFDEILVSKILSKCNDKVARQFSVLLRLDTENMIHNKEQSSSKLLKIIWLSRSESIGCNFIEKREHFVAVIPQLDQTDSVWQSGLHSQSSAVNNPSYFPHPNYQPTMEAINHLRERSPLLACLAYLIIGDDFVTIPTVVSDASTTSSIHPIIKSTAQLDEQLMEIRSYKYSRITNEYPAIGNWIMTFWSEWNISQNTEQMSSINVGPAPNVLATYCRSTIPIEIRWAAFTHPLTKNFDQIIIDYSLNVLSRDSIGYLDIGAALRMLQSQTMVTSSKLQRLLDITLQKAARYWANGLIVHTNNRGNLPPDYTQSNNDSFKIQEKRLLDCIYAIQDDELRLTESSRYLDLFNIENALKLMEFNYSLRRNNENEELNKQVVKMRIFKRIHDLVLTCQSKYEIMWRAHIPTEFLDWHRLHTLSESDPDLVLKFLIRQKQFDLAKSWSKFYMSDHGEQKVEAEYLVSLVNEGNDNEKVVELISHIRKLHCELKPEKFMKIIHYVLGHFEAPFAIIFICAYTIKNNIFNDFEFSDNIPVCEWRDRVHRSWVGASMLRSISNEVIREQYSQLVEYPHLIMEQLIMNSEIDVFRKMMDLYKEQKKAYISMTRSPTTNKLYRTISMESGNFEGFIAEMEPDRINVLLTEYICKALELSAVRSDEDVEFDEVSLASRMMSSRLSYSSLRVDLNDSTESAETVVNLNRKHDDNSDTNSAAERFAMPTMPPTPDKWYKDSDTSKCMCCAKEKFSMFNRRHHCRRCGRVICSQCSTHRMLIDGVTVRICDDCNHSIVAQQDSDDRARHGNIIFDNKQVGSVADLIYSRHNLPHRSESVASMPSVPTFEQLEMSHTTLVQLGVGALENGWRLSTDASENDFIRQMFNYDDAPSVTVAFSLADFHSNSNVCGNLLLDRVEYLADFLKPMKNHLPNPEVDYLLVIDMAKQIAYKAKLKFSRLNNDMDFDRAENYLSRLDLLSVLVRSNFGNYLPSLGEGSKFIERIQSLRDKLIREERLELAATVSSKAGLSNDPVFVAMGLHALDEGRYEDARKLFSSCSKLGRQGTSTTTTLPYPVNEIMKILDGNKLSVNSLKEMVDNSMDSEELIKYPDLKFREHQEVNRKQVEEAIYYLETYDAHLHCLQFLSRRQLWSKALDYVFKKNVSKEVFIEGLISPSVHRGYFAAVKSELLMKDGGLSSWRTYYEPLCKFMDKKCLYDDLLEFQEIIGDHLQAARTLTNYFYLRGAQTYLMLRDKIGYLEKAQKHLEMYINQKERNPNFELEKLMKNLILVKCQIDATLFLTDPITVNHHQAKLGYIVKSSSPPTLFGTAEAIVDFCLMILFCRPNLSDGLQRLCPLMTQCHIYPEKVLPKAAIWLLQHPQSIQTMTVDSETAGVTAVFDLCTNICSCYRLDTRKTDEILIAILPVVPQSLLTKSNLASKFIALFQSETKKIDAYLIVKDFKRAFSCAVRFRYVNEVQRILELAESANDLSGVIDLCRQWLSQNVV